MTPPPVAEPARRRSLDETPARRPIPLAVLGIALLSLVALGLLPYLQLGDGTNIPRLALFMGRFHPVVLHVPIGMILLAIILEHAHVRGLRRWIPKVPPGTSTFLMFFAAVTATVSTVLGWMLSFSGGYDPVLLHRHFLAGLTTAIGANLALLLKLISDSRPASRRRVFPTRWCWWPRGSRWASRGTGGPRLPTGRIILPSMRPIPCGTCSGCRCRSTPRISPGSRSRNASPFPRWWARS